MKQNLSGRLPEKRSFAQFLLGDYAGYLFFLSSTTLLPLMVTHQAGSEANAYFYQAWIIANSLMLVAMNATASLTVEVARAASMLQVYGRRVFGHSLKMLGPTVIAVVVFAPYILSLFGESYAREGTATLRLLSLSALPSIVVLLGIAQARLQQRMVEVVVIQGTMSLLVLGLSIVLLDRLGIIGVGVAWLSSQLLLALTLLVTRVRWLVGAPPTTSVG